MKEPVIAPSPLDPLEANYMRKLVELGNRLERTERLCRRLPNPVHAGALKSMAGEVDDMILCVASRQIGVAS